MLRTLFISLACMVGATLAATFFTAPVPEDPAHPGQCYDESSRTWHREHESWKRGGECLESTCILSVGYQDPEKGLKNLEEISPRIFRRYVQDSDWHKKPYGVFKPRNKTITFKARGEEQQYLFKEGDKPISPQAFVSEHIISCFYHVKLPSNCQEVQSDPRLPFPECCPQLKCNGEPLGAFEAVG